MSQGAGGQVVAGEVGMLYCPQMSKEHRSHPNQPAEIRFGLTEQERLWNRVSDQRLQAILQDPATTIHKAEVSANNYGEYLFVTLSREHVGQRIALCFWGMGYHEQREQWILDHWRWYSKNASFLPDRTLPLETAQSIIQVRREDIAPYITDDPPSERARLFAILADLTDEDGAQVELEDLEYLTGGLFDTTPPEDADDV